ncbi:MAG: phosphoribosylanthranilate isomerase [Sinobacterium sp.]|nr:phosphoribosylanthranilate isomerase [Sinobacterium sp.]
MTPNKPKTAATLNTRVKICGITSAADMLIACQAGADAIGLVFYEPSKRHVSIEQAASIAAQLPPFVQLVGLFVNAQKSYIEDVLKQVPLQLIQFHGEESAAFCESFDQDYIKAIAVKPDEDLVSIMNLHPKALGFLLDTYKAGVPGGTGETFDWGLFPSYPKPLILAGGLNANNVSDAIRRVRPYAVDISGGVEASAGIKSPDKLFAFIGNAKQTSNDDHE